MQPESESQSESQYETESESQSQSQSRSRSETQSGDAVLVAIMDMALGPVSLGYLTGAGMKLRKGDVKKLIGMPGIPESIMRLKQIRFEEEKETPTPIPTPIWAVSPFKWPRGGCPCYTRTLYFRCEESEVRENVMRATEGERLWFFDVDQVPYIDHTRGQHDGK